MRAERATGRRRAAASHGERAPIASAARSPRGRDRRNPQGAFETSDCRADDAAGGGRTVPRALISSRDTRTLYASPGAAARTPRRSAGPCGRVRHALSVLPSPERVVRGELRLLRREPDRPRPGPPRRLPLRDRRPPGQGRHGHGVQGPRSGPRRDRRAQGPAHRTSPRRRTLARRFRHEIKLARKVRHRNVCGIHEYGEDGRAALHRDGPRRRRRPAARAAAKRGPLPPSRPARWRCGSRRVSRRSTTRASSTAT